MNKDDLRDVLYDFLDRLEIDASDVDDITEEFLSELEDAGILDTYTEE